MLPRLAAVLLCLPAFPAAGRAAAAPGAPIVVAPARTSIYIGRITLTMPPFVRQDGTYTATYSARVFPYFFYSETGRMWIDVSDDDLRRLAGGAPVDFTGHGRSDDGDERRIAGRATPADAVSGKIKVRVFVSKRIELVFNTTYRFAPPAGRP